MVGQPLSDVCPILLIRPLLKAVGPFQLPTPCFGTLPDYIYLVPDNQCYFRRLLKLCLLDTSALSMLEVLDDNCLLDSGELIDIRLQCCMPAHWKSDVSCRILDICLLCLTGKFWTYWSLLADVNIWPFGNYPKPGVKIFIGIWNTFTGSVNKSGCMPILYQFQSDNEDRCRLMDSNLLWT